VRNAQKQIEMMKSIDRQPNINNRIGHELTIMHRNCIIYRNDLHFECSIPSSDQCTAGSLLSHRKLTISRNKYVLGAACNGTYAYKLSRVIDSYAREGRERSSPVVNATHTPRFFIRGMNSKKKYFQL
jgi:hypothetical protein